MQVSESIQDIILFHPGQHNRSRAKRMKNSDWKQAVETLVSSFTTTRTEEDAASSSASNDKQIEKSLKFLEEAHQNGLSDDTLTSLVSSLEHYCFLRASEEEGDCITDNDEMKIITKKYHLEEDTALLLLPICEFMVAGEDSSPPSSSSKKVTVFIQFVNFLLSHCLMGDEENETQTTFIEQAIEQRDEAILATVLEEDLFRFWEKIIAIIIHSIDGKSSSADETSFKQKEVGAGDVGGVVNSSSFTIDPDNPSGAIIAAGDFAAEKIYGGAKFLNQSLSNIIPSVTGGIETLGDFAKNNIQPDASKDSLTSQVGNDDDDDNDDKNPKKVDKGHGNDSKEITEDDIVAFTEASVQATDVFRSSTEALTSGIYNISSKGINNLSNNWKKNEIGKELCEQDELRESFAAIGKIGIATVGATLNVAEAIFNVTKAGKPYFPMIAMIGHIRVTKLIICTLTGPLEFSISL